jgi:hypothetical protein
MHIRHLLFLSLFVFCSAPGQLKAQTTDTTENEEQLMDILNSEQSKPAREYTTATFKTTRIGNGHSIENTPKGVLDFRVSHRFGYLNQGVKDFFGLDNATTRIAFDYGITNWLMVGVGRSSYLKEYDGFVKVRLLRQRENGGFPISVSYMGGASVQTYQRPSDIPDTLEYYFSNRLAYVNQILIARKFSNTLSLQLMPTHVHYNMVNYSKDGNDVIAIGIGGRLKLSNRISLTAEYYYQLPGTQLHDPANPSSFTRNPLTLGIDIETGGHVFQLLFTNAADITERNVIGQTTGAWDKGDIHFGFNISRVFTIVKPKGFENSRNKIW